MFSLRASQFLASKQFCTIAIKILPVEWVSDAWNSQTQRNEWMNDNLYCAYKLPRKNILYIYIHVYINACSQSMRLGKRKRTVSYPCTVSVRSTISYAHTHTTHTCMHAHTYIHTHTHTHTHTDTGQRQVTSRITGYNERSTSWKYTLLKNCS